MMTKKPVLDEDKDEEKDQDEEDDEETAVTGRHGLPKLPAPPPDILLTEEPCHSNTLVDTTGCPRGQKLSVKECSRGSRGVTESSIIEGSL
jgi:hypothetical protein